MSIGPENLIPLQKDNDGRSPIPDITGEELRNHIINLRQDMKEIKVALKGNELGTPGVLPRLTNVESKCEAHDRKLLVWGAILTAAGSAAVFLKDFFLHGG